VRKPNEHPEHPHQAPDPQDEQRDPDRLPPPHDEVDDDELHRRDHDEGAMIGRDRLVVGEGRCAPRGTRGRRRTYRAIDT
jgi:hypothetical protein